MINELELSRILTDNNKKKFNDIKLIKNYKILFGSPLKKFICNIYNQFEIPIESFYISIYYINNFYKRNSYDNIAMNNLFENINCFIFSSIIIALKILLDDTFNIKLMCEILSLNYKNYKNIELILLKGLDWNISVNNNIDYLNFKTYLVYYKDFSQHKN